MNVIQGEENEGLGDHMASEGGGGGSPGWGDDGLTPGWGDREDMNCLLDERVIS